MLPRASRSVGFKAVGVQVTFDNSNEKELAKMNGDERHKFLRVYTASDDHFVRKWDASSGSSESHDKGGEGAEASRMEDEKQ